jgi:hypothetical protein
MRRRVALVVTAALAVPVVPSSGNSPEVHAAYVRSCWTYAFGAEFITSARNMTCRAAAREQRTTEGHRSDRVTRHHFHCRPVDYNHVRCHRGRRAYRWTSGA